MEAESHENGKTNKREIGVFEWSKGDIYLGLLKESSDADDEIIINCEKPLGKIINSAPPQLEIFLKEENRNQAFANYIIMMFKPIRTKGAA